MIRTWTHLFHILLPMLNVIIIMYKIYIERITFRHKIRKSMAKLAIMLSFSSLLKRNWLPINCMKNRARARTTTNFLLHFNSRCYFYGFHLYLDIVRWRKTRQSERTGCLCCSFICRTKYVCVCKKQWTKQISTYTLGITVIRMKLDCIHGIVFYHKEIAFFRFT